MFSLLSLLQVMLFLFWGQSRGESPFSRNDVQHCTYHFSGENKFIKATSQTFHLNYFSNKTIHYKLCGQFGLGEECPTQTVACLKDHITGKEISLGNKFTLERNEYLSSKNGSRCGVTSQSYSVSIFFQAANNLTPSVVSYENCIYKINMFLPVPSTKCWLEIHGKHLDFTSLSKRLKVISPERNFSLTLCDREPSCGSENYSACEIVGKTVNPLSTTSSLIPFYNGDENQIVFKGHTVAGPNNKINKRLEVRLKCNWEKTKVRDEDLTYIKVPTQGRRYAFNLETSYGCIKEDKPCIVKQGNLLYNLSNLYFDHPHAWQVKGKNSTYFIQVCEPLSVSSRICDDTAARVCEESKYSHVNRGSILSNLEVINDVVRATIDNGEKCINDQHKTFIDFVCDSKERGPEIKKLEDQTDCEEFFEWRTPEACPNYDLNSCSNVEEVSYSCLFNEHGKSYDLNPLRGVKVILDDSNPKISFSMNVCGAVLDRDAPCTKDVSVARKNSSEPNVKFRFTSLGKFLKGTNIDGSLVLHYRVGGYCDGSDYQSQIRFECNKEEKISLERHEKCFYAFLWKTPHGCPKISMNETDFANVNCSFTDSESDQRIEFDPIVPMQVNEKTRKTTFYFCSRIYSSCSLQETDCPKISLGKGLVNVSNNLTSVQFNLNNICNTKTQEFNVVILNIKCQVTKSQKGYVPRLDGCTLNLDYFTAKACNLQRIPDLPDISLEEVSSERQNTKEHIKTNVDQFLHSDNHQNSFNVINQDCSIKSPYTKTEVNLHSFNINYFKEHCPTSTKFNKTFEYVRLLYSTNAFCPPEPTRNMSYEVFLFCSTGKAPPLNSKTDVCLSMVSYKDQEYCNLFKAETLAEASNSLLIAGSILGSVFFIALLSLAVFYRKSKCGRAERPCELLGLYERDVLS